MESLSYQEKSLYGSLAAEILVYGPYFFFHQQNSLAKVVGMIFGIILLQIVLQIIIAASSRNRTKDERDKFIELRGYRVGYFVLASLMVCGLGLFWLHVAFGSLDPTRHNLGLHFLSGFFGMLVIADIAKTVAQLIAYRRVL